MGTNIYTYVNIWPFPDLANALIQTLLGNLELTSDVSSEVYKTERVPWCLISHRLVQVTIWPGHFVLWRLSPKILSTFCLGSVMMGPRTFGPPLYMDYMEGSINVTVIFTSLCRPGMWHLVRQIIIHFVILKSQFAWAFLKVLQVFQKTGQNVSFSRNLSIWCLHVIINEECSKFVNENTLFVSLLKIEPLKLIGWTSFLLNIHV
jgi:hypothetical protein